MYDVFPHRSVLEEIYFSEIIKDPIKMSTL